MPIYYVVYIYNFPDDSVKMYSMHTKEEEANDILQSLTSLSEDNKWITRIKTDTKGVIQ